ncbi:MAG: hypothetical protein ACQETH_08730 [Candidatus Rifleibacteriota bacterium]
MTKQEFKEYYKKNKTVVIGVPIILAILLLDFFVLKPARQKKLEERNADNKPQTTQSAPATQGKKSPEKSQEKAPIKMPDPIRPPVYPPLSNQINERFQLSKQYPFPSNQRNIFQAEKDDSIQIIPEMKEEIAQTVVRPDISYHGFFSLGPDKVAILKSTGRLLLTKTGAMLKSSPFQLASVFPDHVVIVDTDNTDRAFEVALSENTNGGGNK